MLIALFDFLCRVMAFTLRPYQLDAVNATISYFRQHSTPAVIVLPTGAGKSLVIAELAKKREGVS